eukprot:762998-Hanusia_phi.AAC.1
MDEKEQIIVGVDEAGRGCLFGPVVAAAVILPDQFPDDVYKDIKDSKKLSPKKREILAQYIYKNALAIGVGIVDNHEIDRINILRATYEAMHKALHQAYAKKHFDFIKVDGNRFLPFIPSGEDADVVPHECIIKGDDTVLCISAASIIAKTTRDNIIADMVNADPELNRYMLLSNKGYGTKKHFDALMQYGLTDKHRLRSVT